MMTPKKRKPFKKQTIIVKKSKKIPKSPLKNKSTKHKKKKTLSKKVKNVITYVSPKEVITPTINISNVVVKREDVIKDAPADLREYDSDVVRQRRRGRNTKDKMYFTKKTEEAIIEYNKETDDFIRNEIYDSRIRYGFEKLVENIFNTFKFTYFYNSPIDIQRETVSHLVQNIHKFEEGKGKAFSYFSIVAKNYLIFHNNSNYKRFNMHVEISETPASEENNNGVCLQSEDAHHKNVQNKELMNLIIKYWEENISKIFTKIKDISIANAVIELLRGCDRLESFNKKTLYLYIREMSNCRTQAITKILNKMKIYQNVIVRAYYDRGNLEPKEL